MDESHYQHPQIRRVFELIEQDHISPTERARMFDEHGDEELRQEEFQKGKQAQKMETARNMLTKGFEIAVITELLGLTEAELADLTEAESAA